ncbi:unnamed protein product [Medioppia subpectinata]|uniref:Uncharacterized protein n=1 Tax=Medioppia subpectinata TaxID=1979941 RepID=A0A7R9KK89_9ACAR|nr:unnamed protein product [Medioppia subpectinata]CAG2104962.1 unnamed protein product [Medioppia subpectinata]
MEVQLQKALTQASGASQASQANTDAIVGDLRKKCDALEKDKQMIMKEMQKTKDESTTIQSELDRLLKIMSNSEEEKFALNKQIQEMQNALRAAQSSGTSQRRNTQSAQQLEEGRPPPMAARPQSATGAPPVDTQLSAQNILWL